MDAARTGPGRPLVSQERNEVSGDQLSMEGGRQFKGCPQSLERHFSCVWKCHKEKDLGHECRALDWRAAQRGRFNERPKHDHRTGLDQLLGRSRCLDLASRGNTLDGPDVRIGDARIVHPDLFWHSRGCTIPRYSFARTAQGENECSERDCGAYDKRYKAGPFSEDVDLLSDILTKEERKPPCPRASIWMQSSCTA